MDLSSLIELGQKALEKKSFKKFLGDITVKQASKKISKLVSEIKKLDEEIEAPLSGLGPDNDEKPKDRKLTPLQRRLNRQNRKENRKERIKEKREELKKDLKKLQQKTIPRFEVYTITGRVYDSQTAEPLKGVKINVGIDQTQLTGQRVNEIDTGVKTPKELDSVLQTDVKLASDFRPYVPVPVLIPEGQNTTTNANGYYNFQIKTLVIGEEISDNSNEKRELKSLLEIGLLFSKSGYLPNTTSVITLKNSIKRDISAVGLFNIQFSSEKEKDKINNTIYKASQKVNELFLSGIEKIIVGRKKSIQKVTNLLTQKLIPLLISILIAFGISKISQKDQAICPSPDQLKDAIKKRNKAVKQINQLFTAVIINTGLAAIFLVLANSLRGIRLSIDALPFPMAVGTPPAKDFGGLAASIKYNLIARLQRIDDLLEELEDRNEGLNKQILIALAFLITGLIIAKLLLKTTDDLVKKCAQEKIDSGEIKLEVLREEIQMLENDQQVEQQSKPKPFINGFILSVTELNQQVGTLKPRQAIAKNRDGVIQLKGEPSFSATDQILIDELAFYIKSNNLKAF